ncbi:hypothetical protein J6590_032222 [Homalodisca vitripennis]|nr:hypothetical protein J6590_032222 [Homalodisca vitripennis]
MNYRHVIQSGATKASQGSPLSSEVWVIVNRVFNRREMSPLNRQSGLKVAKRERIVENLQ